MGSSTYSAWFANVFNTVAAVSTATTTSPAAGVSSYTDPIWLAELPDMVEFAENRIYRDADLLASRIVDNSAVLSSGQRTFVLPNTIGTWIVVENISVAGSPLVPYSRAYLDAAWPGVSTVAGGYVMGLPQSYCMQNPTTIVLGPIPDQAYPVTVVGTQRPIPLSAANPVTFLTTYCPDLFFAATMVRATGFMRDLGQQSDNPQLTGSWEATYQSLFKSMQMEEARRQYRSAGWTAQTQLPQTTPPRQ